jgi:hypothetical protein
MHNRTIAGLITTIALAIGVIGTAAHAETPPPSAKPSAPPAAPASGQPAGAEQPEASGQPENSASEAADTAALAAQARVSEADARNAALAKFPGATIVKASLGDENGTVIWEIELADSANAAQDVKVDAVTGAVLAAEAGDTNESGGND